MLDDTTMYRIRNTFDFFMLSVHQSTIDGFLHDIQGYVLTVLAEQGPANGAIVEIGSFKGKSTYWLATGAKRAGREKVYAVDHFTGSPEHQADQPGADKDLLESGSTFSVFQANLRRFDLSDYVEPIVAASHEAAKQWNQPIRLLFIDADHSYELSKLDFESWAPFVVPGGVVVFHDINEWPGVTKYYHELMQSTQDYEEVLDVMGLSVIQKKR